MNNDHDQKMEKRVIPDDALSGVAGGTGGSASVASGVYQGVSVGETCPLCGYDCWRLAGYTSRTYEYREAVCTVCYSEQNNWRMSYIIVRADGVYPPTMVTVP